MIFSFDPQNLINQYTIFSIPFLVLIGGVLLSRFHIGGRK